jgi:hypothetical protein
LRSITLATDTIEDVFRVQEIDAAETFIKDMPTYTASPEFCPVNIEVSIKYVGVPQGTAFPSFITYNDTNIVIQTSDDMGIKAYNFEVEALDEDSGVKNTEVEFSVTSAPVDVATQITLVSSSAIAD